MRIGSALGVAAAIMALLACRMSDAQQAASAQTIAPQMPAAVEQVTVAASSQANVESAVRVCVRGFGQV